MKKKAIIIVAILVLACFGFMGCSDKSPGGSSEPTEVDGEMPSDSGWIDSSGGGDPSQVDSVINVNINHTTVVSAEFVITIEDSDSAHSDTDEGGEPDEVTVYVSGASGESERVSGTTPFTQTITAPTANTTSEDGAEGIGPDWKVHIQAACNSGKNPKGPGGIVPIPFLVYIDQGVAYTLEVTYTYEE